jgi:hypothetical protein
MSMDRAPVVTEAVICELNPNGDEWMSLPDLSSYLRASIDQIQRVRQHPKYYQRFPKGRYRHGQGRIEYFPKLAVRKFWDELQAEDQAKMEVAKPKPPEPVLLSEDDFLIGLEPQGGTRNDEVARVMALKAFHSYDASGVRLKPALKHTVDVLRYMCRVDVDAEGGRNFLRQAINDSESAIVETMTTTTLKPAETDAFQGLLEVIKKNRVNAAALGRQEMQKLLPAVLTALVLSA